MNQGDLAGLKHLGAYRLKLLHDHGIADIRQLYEMPEEKLSAIKSIGKHYAKLIKNSVTDHYQKNQEKPAEGIETPKKRKIEETNRDFRKKMKKLKNSLDRANEHLRPLGKEKYLDLYIDFRKKARKLTFNMIEVGQIEKDLTRKTKKKIIREAVVLATALKKTGKRPKRKKYKEINAEIQSFSRMLRDVLS